MPKPVKKAAPKKPAAKKATKAKKRSSSDPNKRAHQLMADMEAKQATGQPPWAKDFAPAGVEVTVGPEKSFDEQFKTRMAELGRKGGKVSGAKRMEMPAEKRSEIALKAAQARWAKKKRQK